jgi:hypothetical protein
MNAQLNPSELELLTELARSPATQKAAEAAHAREVLERQQRNERIAELDRSREKTWPAGQRGIEAAAKKVRAAERALRDANEALATSHTDDFSASHEYSRSRMAEVSALSEGADLPTIAAWKDELLAELSALGRPGLIVTHVVVTRAESTGQPIRSGASNMASIVSRMKAVRQAYEDSDLLKLEPDQRKLPSIIAAIRAGWPAVDNNPSQPTKA